MSPPYRTMLFDLDGTLIDSTQLIFESYRETLSEHGFPPVTDADLMAGFGEPLQKNLVRLTGTTQNLETLVETYSRINAAKHDGMVRAFEGVSSALQTLSERGVRMGVVTGKRRRFAVRGLEVCRLDGFFELVWGPEEYSKPKPNPEPVQEALQAMNMPVETAVYVGDAPADMLCGRSAGVATAAVAWAECPRAQLEATAPDHVLERPEDFVSLAPSP